MSQVVTQVNWTTVVTTHCKQDEVGAENLRSTIEVPEVHDPRAVPITAE
jgi:hypothetical protein